MVNENKHDKLPAYQHFCDATAVLDLSQSPSELHGMICAYLCAGAYHEAEIYLRALLGHNKDEATRMASMLIFDMLSASQHQIQNFDFEFQMFLPEEHESIADRAQAFSEWCDGFLQGLAINGFREDDFEDEEARETLYHLQEFAELDFEGLSSGEEDEKALMEVTEYARMAVLRLFGEIQAMKQQPEETSTTH